MMHEKKWTYEKLRGRLGELKREALYQKKMPLPDFKVRMSCETFDKSEADDSEWDLLKPGSYWGEARQDFILRTSFNVPPDWRKPIALYLPLGISKSLEPLSFLYGPEALALIDGHPFQGIDPNHQELFLSDDYLDGQTHVLELLGWTGIEDERYEALQPLLVEINDSVREFALTVDVGLKIIDELPNENPQRDKLLGIFDHAFLGLNLHEPIGDKFCSSVKDANCELQQEIRNIGFPMDVKVSGVGHAHIDVAWLWTLRQTRKKVARTFSTVLKLMDQYPDFYFSQSQPQLYRFIEDDYPELMEQIKARVTEGRWEIMGGMWVEADCNITGAESLVRQFLLGRKYFVDCFGKRDAPILWLPDVFGYAWQLPQIMDQVGISYFVTAKMSWNQYNRIPNDIFWWEGLDGTKIFTYFITTSKPGWWGATYSAELTPEEIMNTWTGFQNKAIHDEFMIPFGHGDGGGGPTMEMLERGKRMENFPGFPKVKFSTAESFLRRTREKAGGKMEVWNGELYLELHRGTYTSQAMNKRLNRKCEFLLHDVEFLSAWALLLGNYTYPYDQLHRAWELLCLNQFHDIIPGSAIGEVYKDSRSDYKEIMHIGNQLLDKALEALDRFLPDSASFVIYNPTSFLCSTVVEIPSEAKNRVFRLEDGSILPVQPLGENSLVEVSDIPSYGFVLIRCESRENCVPEIETGVRVTKNSLENDLVYVEFNDDGDLIRLYDKENCREVLSDDLQGNLIQAFEDRPLDWEAWDIDIYYQEKSWNTEPASEIQVIESGPLRGCLRIKRRILRSEIIQHITLHRNSARLDFRTWVDWKERKMLLKVAFPVSILSVNATYEIQWGNVERPTHQNTSWDWARFESCAHKWVDLSEGDYGVSLLNDCKYGHDIQGNVIRLTLLKGATFPDPLADLGEHEFTYSILPHANSWKDGTVPEAYALNNPPIIREVSGVKNIKSDVAKNYLLRVRDEKMIIETVKASEDGNGLIVRMYEHKRTRGVVSLETSFKVRQAHLTNLLEENQSPIAIGRNRIEHDFSPYQIMTMRLINEEGVG